MPLEKPVLDLQQVQDRTWSALGCAALIRHDSAVQHIEASRNRPYEIQKLFDQQNGDMQLLLNGLYHHLNLLNDGWLDAFRRLVQNQQLGARD